MGWTVGDLNPGCGQRFFSSPKSLQTTLGLTQPLIILVVVKWLVSEANHSPLSSARLRMSGAIPLLTSVCLHGVNRDNFTFCFTFYKDYFSIDPTPNMSTEFSETSEQPYWHVACSTIYLRLISWNTEPVTEFIGDCWKYMILDKVITNSVCDMMMTYHGVPFYMCNLWLVFKDMCVGCLLHIVLSYLMKKWCADVTLAVGQEYLQGRFDCEWCLLGFCMYVMHCRSNKCRLGGRWIAVTWSVLSVACMQYIRLY